MFYFSNVHLMCRENKKNVLEMDKCTFNQEDKVQQDIFSLMSIVST